jgi:urease accessory protein
MENPHGRWFGSLELGFERAGSETILRRSRHVGPLRVQRPFRESDGACQVYILNPPGGTVGGDELRIYANLGAGSKALLTAPGAAKFYRSAGPEAKALQHFQLAADSRLEWLPQETIVYDGAVARVSTRIDLASGAKFAGWELTCLGRPAASELFQSGRWAQRFELYLDGRPLWLERTAFRGGDPALSAIWGLADRAAFGSFAVHPVSMASLERARELCEAASSNEDWLGATLLEHPSTGSEPQQPRFTLVVRFAGPSAARGRDSFARIWAVLRPLELGSEPEPPRIWAT